MKELWHALVLFTLNPISFLFVSLSLSFSPLYFFFSFCWQFLIMCDIRICVIFNIIRNESYWILSFDMHKMLKQLYNVSIASNLSCDFRCFVWIQFAFSLLLLLKCSTMFFFCMFPVIITIATRQRQKQTNQIK